MTGQRGPIRSFPGRGFIKSRPYPPNRLRLQVKLDVFTPLLELKLTAQENRDLVAFLRVM